VSFEWPEFSTQQPLDGGRSWTAAFDSYDQYRENCYYLVRIFDGEQWVDEFMACVDTTWMGDDWTVPTWLPELTARIAGIAASGKTNTDWRG
jgi:hypothetical protein